MIKKLFKLIFKKNDYGNQEILHNENMMNIDFLDNEELKFYDFGLDQEYLKYTNIFQNKYDEKYYKNEEYIISKDFTFSYNNLDEDFKYQIENNNFWEYANEVIKLKYMLKKYKNCEDRLLYSNELFFPLTDLYVSFKDLSFIIFNLVFKICNDRKNFNKMPFLTIKNLINLLMNSPDEIKDEAFLILIKQVRKNKHIEKGYKEWKLFSIISSFICPSSNSYFYILNYIYTQINNNSVFEIKQWALYIMKKLINFKTKKERLVIPSLAEFQLISMKRKFKLKIHFGNGSFQIFFVEGYDNINTLKKKILKKFNIDIKLKNYFGILEVCSYDNKLNENYIENEIIVADVLSSWHNENEFYEENNIDVLPKFRLFFKYRFKIEEKEDLELIDSDILENFEYMNNYYNYNFGRLLLNLDSLTILAGYKLYLEFGPYKKDKKKIFKKELFKIIPKLSKEFYIDYQSILFDEIIENYKNVRNINYLDVIKKFNKQIKELNFDFAEFYNVQSDKTYNNIENFIDEMIIMIKPDSIVFLNQQYETIYDIGFKYLVKWGFNDNYIFFIFNEKEEIKIKLKSKMTTTISYNLKTNMNKLIGLTIEDNNYRFNKNVTQGSLKNNFFKRVNEFKIRKV